MPDPSVNQNPTPKDKQAGKAAEVSKVVVVDDKNFEAEVIEASKKQTVLVDFSAKWCGPCRRNAPILEEFAKKHPDVKVVSVDVDKSSEIAKKNNVESLPYFVTFKNGEKQEKTQLGFSDLGKLEELVGPILPAPLSSDAGAAKAVAAVKDADLKKLDSEHSVSKTVEIARQATSSQLDQEHGVASIIERARNASDKK